MVPVYHQRREQAAHGGVPAEHCRSGQVGGDKFFGRGQRAALTGEATDPEVGHRVSDHGRHDVRRGRLCLSGRRGGGARDGGRLVRIHWAGNCVVYGYNCCCFVSCTGDRRGLDSGAGIVEWGLPGDRSLLFLNFQENQFTIRIPISKAKLEMSMSCHCDCDKFSFSVKKNTFR